MRNEEDHRKVEETIGPEGDTIKVHPHHDKHEGHHPMEHHEEIIGPEGDTVKVVPHPHEHKHEVHHPMEHHEDIIGPEGDTVKIVPHPHHHEGHHAAEHHDAGGHIRTDPEKRHGDALLEGNGSRQGSVDPGIERQY